MAAQLPGADPTTSDLVGAVQSALAGTHLDLIALKEALIQLLQYLASAEGRTDGNCRAVDLFFLLDDLWVKRNLPAPFCDLFGDMGGCLHDAVSAPKIAENFDSTPEQLLERAKRLSTEPPAPGDGDKPRA